MNEQLDNQRGVCTKRPLKEYSCTRYTCMLGQEETIVPGSEFARTLRTNLQTAGSGYKVLK